MNARVQFTGQSDPWSRRRAKKAARLARIAPWMDGPVLQTGAIVEALQALLEPGDAVALEGDNQKQADFLSRSLVQADPAKIHDLHLLISSVSRPEHLTLFERGIARKIDLAFAGPLSERLAQLLEDGKLEIGAIHTYVKLYSRMFVDLMPDVALVCAEQADHEGNLYTGPNTEDTPSCASWEQNSSSRWLPVKSLLNRSRRCFPTPGRSRLRIKACATQRFFPH